jgi:hypothetical protein
MQTFEKATTMINGRLAVLDAKKMKKAEIVKLLEEK